MKLNEETKNKVISFIENFSRNIGKKLYFREAICTNKDNFDRHFTTFSSTEFILTNISARISGARLMFAGEKLAYEIGIDYIIQFEERENEIEFLEAYSEKIYRQTILKISDENNWFSIAILVFIEWWKSNFFIDVNLNCNNSFVGITRFIKLNEW